MMRGVLFNTIKSLWIVGFMGVVPVSVMGQLGDCPPTTEYHYLHLAHTRTGSNPLMDPVVEKSDYSFYDMLWLGGDMALATSQDDTVMMHVDSIFNLGNENTLWALGNHDYADLERVKKFTHRNAYYASHKNDITFLVLDTQDSLSNITGEQLELFRKVTDTIQNSTHLILLHHKLIWMHGNPQLESQIASVTNGGFGDCFYCINPNNFYQDIYPRLVELEERGIEVLCIAGDIGFRKSEFEYITPEGIQFMASGIEAGKSYNKALLFKHNVTNQELDWDYIPTSQLLLPIDTTPPVLNSIFVTPDSVLRGDTVQIILDSEDSGSGLAAIQIDIVNPFGNQLIEISSSDPGSIYSEDGTYTFDVAIPDTAVTGTWHISAFRMIDSSGNILCKHADDFELTSFLVYSKMVHIKDYHHQIGIYPNPGSGIFNIRGFRGIRSIMVMDLTGRIVFETAEPSNGIINLSGQPAGLYIVRVVSESGRTVQERIIIL